MYFSGLDDWSQRIELSVIDHTGRAVWAGKVDKNDLQNGKTSINVLDTGIYYISLMDEENKATRKLVKI